MENVENSKHISIKKRTFFRVKQSFDFIFSFLGIIFLSPLFLWIAIMIKLDDPKGNIIYSQDRVGKNGNLFKMYKFRSMVTNADEELKNLLAKNEIDGPMFKMKNDPRITSIGKFIRKYSLDELPQLFNVLIGDMSLVGPRPPLQREVAQYEQWHMQRLAVKPGCTGLWQVTSRNSANFDDMVKLDLIYIKNLSFWSDLSIIFKTVWIMIVPNSVF